jgi:hypothetical protein
MVGYYAHLVGDLDAGLGAVAFVNGPGRPGAVTRYALDLLLAAKGGNPLPEFDAGDQDSSPAALDEYAGTFRGESGAIALSASPDGLSLATASGERIPLAPAGEDAFDALHPDFASFPLRFGRAEGRVVEAWHGGDWYAADHHPGPTTFDVPPSWRAYLGHYRSHNPWATNLRVVLRQGTLWLSLPAPTPTASPTKNRSSPSPPPIPLPSASV